VCDCVEECWAAAAAAGGPQRGEKAPLSFFRERERESEPRRGQGSKRHDTESRCVTGVAAVRGQGSGHGEPMVPPKPLPRLGRVVGPDAGRHEGERQHPRGVQGHRIPCSILCASTVSHLNLCRGAHHWTLHSDTYSLRGSYKHHNKKNCHKLQKTEGTQETSEHPAAWGGPLQETKTIRTPSDLRRFRIKVPLRGFKK
jgi:hypothetical protein